MIAALDLRFREGDVDDTPPDTDAFLVARPAPRGSIAVVTGTRAQPIDAPVLVFLRHAAFAIPRPHDGEAPLALASWALRSTIFGHLAQVMPATARAPQRTAWVLAAILPLLIATEADAAHAPSVQRPKTSPPELPDAPPETETEAETETEVATDPVVDEPPADPPRLDPPAPLENNREITDAAWEGVDGFDVEIKLKGGGKMSGRVGAVQRDTFTLIQAGTGAVLVLAKSGVRSLRVHVTQPLPKRTGTGALIGGVILTVVGTPVFISGVAIVAVCASCASIHVPLLVIGGAALGAGIPLLVRGARLRNQYRNALEERRLSPIVTRSPHGWTGGIRFRF